MPTWPGTLPQKFSADGYDESPPDNLIRSKPDAGPAKVRRRTTANVRPYKTSLRMTSAQLDTLDTFYVTTLVSGSLAFDWQEPRSLSTKSFRFVSKPKYQAQGGDFWNVALDLEQLP